MSEGPIRIARASCRAMFVFDIGREIDLAACARLFPDFVRPPAPDGGPPASIRVEAPPLRLELPAGAAALDGLVLEPTVAAGVYEFGALALTYCLPVSGTLDDLRAASCRLARETALAAAARRRAGEFLSAAASAVSEPRLADVAEEYLVLEATEFDAGGPLERLVERHARALAATLRSETEELSEQEVTHATSVRVARTPDDLALIDWNAALVFHRRPEQIRDVLELANVQLLEMRFLDRTLDESLHRAYEVVSEGGRAWRTFLPHAMGGAMRRIARRQVDAAILHERVSNALKLVGDQHLARAYRAAAARFELSEWNAANLQKLATLESIYQKVHDRAATLRAEMLEWVVVALILAEIVLTLAR